MGKPPQTPETVFTRQRWCECPTAVFIRLVAGLPQASQISTCQPCDETEPPPPPPGRFPSC